MKLYQFGSNSAEVSFRKGQVLFSYQTAVAAFFPGVGWVKNDKFFSRTTSKHVNKWFRNYNVSPSEVKNFTPEQFSELLAVFARD